MKLKMMQNFKTILEQISVIKYKQLCFFFSKKNGKNKKGRTTVFHKGGGAKKLWRCVLFFKTTVFKNGFVIGFEYDPFKTSWLLQLVYSTGYIGYQIMPNKISSGFWVRSKSVLYEIGHWTWLKKIAVGIPIYGVEVGSFKYKIAVAAGTFCTILDKYVFLNQVLLEVPSCAQKFIDWNNFCFIGRVGNVYHNEIIVGKAGKSRFFGKRPHVRGVAMNPVDHPHGGGEGKSSGGRPSVSPWGKLTKTTKKTGIKKI